MDETVLLPSPNWFLVSNLAVSIDGWLIYGGPSKCLCVLEPLPADKGVIRGSDKYQAHVITRAHSEKIVSVDISPSWVEKKCFLTGSADGAVRQWCVEKISNTYKVVSTHSHEVHHQDKEDIAGVGYSSENIAITAGSYGNVVKWDLSSNVVKTYNQILKNFKPTCMSCSPHIPLNVAVGTKQGVIFVLDLNGAGKILYKVRGQDDEVMNVTWCPVFDLAIKKTLKESDKRINVANNRLAAMRSELEKETNILEQSGEIKNLPEDSFDESVVEEDDMFDIYKDHEADEFGHKKYQPEDLLIKVKEEKEESTDYLAECLKLKEEILKKKNQGEQSIATLVEALDKTHVDTETSQSNQVESQSIESQSTVPGNTQGNSQVETSTNSEKVTESNVDASAHTHKHLLASVGKYGGVRIWSKSGKLVGSCAIPSAGKNPRTKVTSWPTVLWYKSDVLLIVDGKSQLLDCNPLQIDCKNKLEWRLVHNLHKRGLYCIATDAPRVHTSDMQDNWSIWTVAQDRNVIQYCLRRKQKLAVHATCGGFLYDIRPCLYDAGKVAISVGDGAVRVWESSTLLDDDTKLSAGRVTTYWQNVQGKVLTVAWHPTKENLLAFGTAEARVGLIDASGKSEKPARVLQTALSGGVYGLCWGEGMNLYASGNGQLVMYNTNTPHQEKSSLVAPENLSVELEGQTWQICAVNWSTRGLLVGSNVGAVAVLSHTHQLVAANFVFTKMIHAMEWHPQQTSSSSDDSQYKNLIAVSSLDKESAVVILEFVEKEDGVELRKWKSLAGHKSPVFQVMWSPHQEEQLLSTSQDGTARVWDINSGACVSIFGNHAKATLGAAWMSLPQLGDYVMTGGTDGCLRLWNIHEHKAEDYDETKFETKKLTKKNADKKEKKMKENVEETSDNEGQVAASLDKKIKPSKRFILPISRKQILSQNKPVALKKLLQKYIEKSIGDNVVEIGKKVLEIGDIERDVSNKAVEIGDNAIEICDKVVEIGDGDGVKEVECNTDSKDFDLDFLKMFGSIIEVNEVIEKELAYHTEHANTESWIMLMIFRGHIDSMIQFARQKDLLCPYLLSITPCVSFKYWKDATQLYLSQMDRLIAKGEEEKLYENKQYGGVVYRKAATMLSVHDLKGAVAVLIEAKLFMEAYILCRIRYMDSVAEDTLKSWAQDLFFNGNWTMSALCYLALGDLSQASTVLAKSNDQECLSVAASIAKIAGRTTFADHVEQKAQTKTVQAKTEELLEQLPSRIELLLKEDKVQNGNSCVD